MSTDNTYLSVSLRIRHETHSPQEISRLLGHAPDRTGVKGAARGSPRSLAVWPHHYWCLNFDAGEGLLDRVAAVARFLDTRKDAMRSLLRSGGRADIYVFIAPELSTVAFELDAHLLTIIARAGVTLGVEIVPRMEPSET